MVLAGDWEATPIEKRPAGNRYPTPGHISQHISDLYSQFSSVSWGHLALKCIAADRNGQGARQGFWNHHLGLEFQVQAKKTQEEDIFSCRKAYRRGTIPYTPYLMVLGSDIGMDHARWLVWAFSEAGEQWLIDWGSELDPGGVLDIFNTKQWPCIDDGQKYMASMGLMDAKYKKEEVWRVCYDSNQRLWPAAGAGVQNTRQSISFSQIYGYPKWFGLIVFNDRDYKSKFYHDGIQRRKPPGMHFPEDVGHDKEFVAELCREEMDDKGVWKRTGANHYGDCGKLGRVLWDYLMRFKETADSENQVDGEGSES
jgi:hypothetical protein